MKKTEIGIMSEKTEFGPGKTPLYYNNNGLFSDPFIQERLINLDNYKSYRSTTYLNSYWNIDETDASKYNKAWIEIGNLWSSMDEDIPKYCKNEAQLEEEWVKPIFKILGWSYDVQVKIEKHGRKQWPDYSLYSNDRDKKKAKNCVHSKKFVHSTSVADAKAWGVSLDGKGFTNSNPSYQIMHYMELTGKDWGILTNGKYWRIYSTRSNSKYSTFYEVDLEKILQTNNYERFKYFYNFFRSEAFIKDAQINDRCFLDYVFEEGQDYKVRVEKGLKKKIFRVVEGLCKGFLENYEERLNDKEMKEIYDHSLYFTFKLLFILNCESKELLEVNKQDDYYLNGSLRKKVLELKDQWEEGVNWSSQPNTYEYVLRLFRTLEKGDSRIGVHSFGKEVFSSGRAAFYLEHEISDYYINSSIVELSTEYNAEGSRECIDYKLLSPDHMGELFEGLLEHEFVYSPKKIIVKDNKAREIETLSKDVRAKYAPYTINKGEPVLLSGNSLRGDSGSYYTPSYIVDYICEESLSNKVLSKKLKDSIMNLKVCDPSMGSGHFLIGVVKHLENYLEEKRESGEFREGDALETRRMIVENIVCGIDINPLAVELAKFSLWIYSSEKGLPLPVLNKHLVCRDSLGEEPLHKTLAIEAVDAFVGNPPYVNSVILSQNEDYKKFLKEKYESAVGAFDICSLFFEACLSSSPDASISFILPNKLLSTDSSVGMRQYLYHKKKYFSVVDDLSTVPVFKDASVYPVILTISSDSVRKTKYRFHNEKFANVTLKKEIENFDDMNGYYNVLNRYESTFYESVDLGEVCEILGAATVSEAYDFKAAISDKVKSKKKLKFVVSGNVINFGTTWSLQNTQYIKDKYSEPWIDLNSPSVTDKRIKQYKSEKLIVPNMTTILKCFYDNGFFAPAKSTTMIFEKSVPIKVISAFINSKMGTEKYKQLFGSQHLNGGALRIGPPQLRKLPFPKELRDNKKLQKRIEKLHDDIQSEVLALSNKVEPRELKKHFEQNSDDVNFKKITKKLDVLNEIMTNLSTEGQKVHKKAS